jgi:hypothetical protein
MSELLSNMRVQGASISGPLATGPLGRVSLATAPGLHQPCIKWTGEQVEVSSTLEGFWSGCQAAAIPLHRPAPMATQPITIDAVIRFTSAPYSRNCLMRPNINPCPDVLLSNIARICPLPSAVVASVEAQEPPAQNSQIP